MGNIKIKKRSGDTVYLGLNSSGIKLTGDSGSGGGSSDFSTATITVVNNRKYVYTIYGAFLTSGDDEHDVPPMTYSDLYIDGDDTSATTTYGNVIMYKGTAFISTARHDIMTVDGKITKRGNGFVVTGDCTITIPAE